MDILKTAIIIFAGICAAHLSPAARAAGTAQESITITAPWTRATPPGARAASGYMTLTNTGAHSDTLLQVNTPAASMTHIHQMSMQGGVMVMRPIDGNMTLEPGQTITLQPGALHIMMVNLTRPLVEGEMITLTLEFEKAGTLLVELPVLAIGATGP